MSNITHYKKWVLANPEKRKAQNLVFVAKRNKTLVPKPCEVCGKEKSEAHHEDYTKPLEVTWLCKKHHAEADKKRRLKEPEKINERRKTERNKQMYELYKRKHSVIFLSKKYNISRERVYQIIRKHNTN